MKCYGFIAASVCLATAGWGAWPPALVGSFRAPHNTREIAYEEYGGGYIFALVQGTFLVNFYVLTTTGSVVSSSVTGPGFVGLAHSWTPSDEYHFANSNRYIYSYTSAGSLVRSFYCGAGVPRGLGYSDAGVVHGAGLYVACPAVNRVARYNRTTGSLLGTFAGPASAISQYDDSFACDDNTNYLYWDYPNGNWAVIATLPAHPIGLGAAVKTNTDAISARVFVNCADGNIYEYAGVETGVVPCSFGRIRTLFC